MILSIHGSQPSTGLRCATRRQRRRFDVSTFRRFDVSRSAFTLIELMVVVGIIILLVALTVSVVVILNQKAESRRTERTLELLTMALNEWETAAERTITYGTNGVPTQSAVYMISPELQAADLDELHELTHRVLEIISKNAQAKATLQSIDPKLLRTHVEGTEVELSLYDPWDNEIVVIFPGRKWQQGDPNLGPDADGTIVTAFETMFGSCVNGRICFMSAGPDGLLGNVTNSEDMNNDGQPDHIDNIYSYPLNKP